MAAVGILPRKSFVAPPASGEFGCHDRVFTADQVPVGQAARCSVLLLTISPLRQWMIDDMTVRNFVSNAIFCYVRTA